MIQTIVKNESLQNWIDSNLLSVVFLKDKLLHIEGVGKFLVIEPKNLVLPDSTIIENVVFDPEFQVELSDDESDLADDADFLLFQFGLKWYYCDSLNPDELKEFKYIGTPNLTFNTKFSFLGIHGGYELCNGTRKYEDWISKAKFLNIDTLGICELNTLAGTLAFQEACLKAKIKPIIGETISILTSQGGKMHVKLYVENEEGWKNLLWINKIINVDNEGLHIKESELFNRNIKTEGLICVLSPEIDLSKYWIQDKFDFYFSKVYYQIDFVEWSNQVKDEQWLLSIKNYFDNYLFEDGNQLQPILIADAYYLEKDDWEIKKYLNNIGKIGFKNSSKDQYFKSLDDIYLQATELFKEDDDRWNLILDMAIESANELGSSVDFKIPVGQFRLPEYEMTEYEKELIGDNENLFYELVNIGFESKISGKVANEQIYLERLQEEIEVIKKGGFISYFLILNDIIKWCKKEGIWVGMGRGSAAGSLVSYLLDIVLIDPIHYNLLFSRFLNAGRIGKSLPDVDLDFEGGKRDVVKRYMEERYGRDYVTAIGTFGTFKIKSSIKDLCRERGVDYTKTNFIVSQIDDAKASFTELFKLSTQKPDLKEFIQKNHIVFEKIPLCLNQVKNSSIHASGVVVVPKSIKGENIYMQMPVKRIDGNLVSEWEGEWIDKAGFLKFDILGVKQLDKFSEITKLIKKNHGIDITYDSMTLDDPDVFNLFRDGLTEDVFQFGTQGLKAYCKEMKPDNIEDLIAAVALYRPSTMDTGMHKKYIKIKHGIDKSIWDDGTKNATKDTYGIAIYQEQVMQITKDVAGFDLIMADDVRKAMGKKDKDLLDKYKDQFIAGGLKKGFGQDYLEDLWSKLETFAGYGFNRSHAAAYAIMGYFSQWLKVKYPIEFWTVSLQFSEEKEIINIISEISKISNIEIASVDINKSTTEFFADRVTSTVYWALNSVKWVGDKGVESILGERNATGDFYSIEEFCDRVKGKDGVNKRTITNLILAGAFDKIEKINPEQRGLVIKKYFNFTSQNLSEELIETEKWRPYQWVLKQKELTGFGYIDYSKIVKSSKVFASKQKQFKENAEVLFANSDDEEDVLIAGILQNIIERKSKKGVFAQLEIIDNTDVLYITVWNDSYEPYRAELSDAKNKILLINGKVTFDSYKQSNVVHSKSNTKIEII